MKKVLYTATDVRGKEVNGYVEAENNRDAIDLLTKQGYSKIRFHDDISIALDRFDLDDLTDGEIEKIARFEVAVRAKPRLTTFLLEVFRLNKLPILVGLCLFIWGVYISNLYLVIFGLVVSLSMPLLSLWNYRIVGAYDKLLRAYAMGQIEDIETLVKYLKKHMTQPEMAFDLDIRLAVVYASQGILESEIAKLESWRDTLESLSPGMFESRIASVYLLNGESDKYVDLMREAFFKSTKSPTFILDLALAEARLGEVEKGEIVLKLLNAEELPDHGLPFIDWAEAVLEYRKGGFQTEDKFSSAITGFLEFVESPAVWPSLAVCIGDYALSAESVAARERASNLLTSVWGILAFHGGTKLIDQLTDKYPELSPTRGDTRKGQNLRTKLPGVSLTNSKHVKEDMHSLLEELRLAFEEKDHSVTSSLLEPLTEDEIREKCKSWFPEKVPSSIIELYEWKGGQEKNAWEEAFPFWLRDMSFISLDQAETEYKSMMESYGLHSSFEEDGVRLKDCFPFAAFNGGWFVIPASTSKWSSVYSQPVVCVFQGTELYYHSVESMLKTCIECVQHFSWTSENSDIDEDIAMAIWRKYNPGIFEEEL